MARTAFHRKLATLAATPAADLQVIIGAVANGNTDLKSTLMPEIGRITTGLTDHVGTILDALRPHTLPNLVLTEAARDVLSGLAQVEVMTLDKTPDITQNNQSLHKQATGRRMAERKKALAGPDQALATDYANVFLGFKTGDEEERAARLKAVMSLRERVLRHFAEQQVTDTRK